MPSAFPQVRTLNTHKFSINLHSGFQICIMLNALILFSLLLLFSSILKTVGLKKRGMNTHYAFLHSRSINTYHFRVTFTFTTSNCIIFCRTYIVSAAVRVVYPAIMTVSWRHDVSCRDGSLRHDTIRST